MVRFDHYIPNKSITIVYVADDVTDINLPNGNSISQINNTLLLNGNDKCLIPTTHVIEFGITEHDVDNSYSCKQYTYYG